MTNPGYMWMPRDWHSSTFVASLKRHDRDIYRELLDRSWMDEGLPDDLTELARVLGEPRARFAVLWDKLKSHFTLGDDGRWRNGKLEVERTKQAELQARRSDASKRANTVRWGSELESDRRRNGIPNARVSPAPAPAPSLREEKSAPPAHAADAAPPWAVALGSFPALDTPESRDACARWVEHRKKRRLPVWDPHKWHANFERFPTAERLIGAVHYSCVVNSYQSLQEDTRRGSPGLNGHAPKNTRRADGTRPGEFPEPIMFPRVASAS